MNTTTHTTTARNRPMQILGTVRDELRERRQARAEYRALERSLATYNTRTQVDDLLGSIRGVEGADAERVRTILTRNLQHPQQRNMIAS